MLWSLCDPRPDGLITLEYPYFETAVGTHFVETSTYVEHEGELTSPATIEFNHGLGEIFTALMRVGMEITAFEEHDSVPWQALGDQMQEDPATGEFRLRSMPERLAATYTLQAVKH